MLLQAIAIKVGEHDHEQCAHISQKKNQNYSQSQPKQNNRRSIHNWGTKNECLSF
jgi:hypothetical protein